LVLCNQRRLAGLLESLGDLGRRHLSGETRLVDNDVEQYEATTAGG
jgi:hypothetical protein